LLKPTAYPSATADGTDRVQEDSSFEAQPTHFHPAIRRVRPWKMLKITILLWYISANANLT
jgi:hypothetical protein